MSQSLFCGPQVAFGAKITTLRHVKITSVYGISSTQCCKDSAKPCTNLKKSRTEKNWLF